MDLYEIFYRLPDMKDHIMSYFSKYEDNIYIFRMLSKSFNHLNIYHKLKIEKFYYKTKYKNQSKTYIQNFLKDNKIKKLKITEYNKHIYVDPKYYSNLQKISVDSLDEKQFSFFVKYFSKFPIQSLKLKYMDIKYTNNLLQFNQLKTLDITITKKENEDIIFELLKINKNTLRKLKIGIKTGRGIDEQKLVDIIKNNLKLEYIDIRGDLFTYDMIKSNTKIIIRNFKCDFSQIYKLKYLQKLRLHSVKNIHLESIFNSLEMIESIALWGMASNYETYNDEIYEKYKDIIYVDQYDDDHEKYDDTIGKINIKSPFLNHIFLHGFTIDHIELPNINSLESLYIEDVFFKKAIYLPKITHFTIENYKMNPENFNIKFFKFPKLCELNIHHCVLNDLFVYNKIKLLNIQHSLLNINLLYLLKKHHNLKNILFFYNKYNNMNKLEIIKYLKSKKIDCDDNKEW
jgi:hypothetical protein